MTTSDLISIFKQVLDKSKSYLSEFEEISADENISVKLPMIKLAYMEAIIINLAKLFSDLKCDKFGIKQLKGISTVKCKMELEAVETAHKGVIGKIISNRNKLVAHTDPKFYELCFSNNYIKKLEKAFLEDFSHMPKAKEKERERYMPDDMIVDLSEIKEIIRKLDDVWTKILMCNYSKGT